jgi:protein TonB
MKPKKTKKADLRNYSLTFMLIGMVVVLLVTLEVINLKTYAEPVDLGKLKTGMLEIDDDTTIEIEKQKPKIKIEKPKELIDLNIKNNDKKVKEDIFKTTEITDKDSIIDVSKIETDNIEDPDVEVVFTLVEQVPVFPGCKGNKEQLKKCMNEKIRRLVAKNFNTEIAQDLGLSGERVRIFTQFTIDKDGRITAIKTRSKYKDLEKEAVKVIKLFPKMKPGKQRGRPVRVTYTLPIIFNVEEE